VGIDAIMLRRIDELFLLDKPVVYTKAFDEYLNGGFLFIKPDGGQILNDLLDIIREGDFRVCHTHTHTHTHAHMDM